MSTPAPPPDLTDEARAKWAEIIASTDGELSPLTLDAIASYARAYGDEQQALILLKECANPFLLATDGALNVNPLRKIIDKARQQMAQLRREIGLNVQPAATTTEHKHRLLAEIKRRHLALADITPRRHEKKSWEAEMEYGPLFSATNWFDCANDDAERMRWQRAMSALIDEGLVITNREEGCKWPNVKLTPKGETPAESLMTEEDHDEPTDHS